MKEKSKYKKAVSSVGQWPACQKELVFMYLFSTDDCGCVSGLIALAEHCGVIVGL